MFYTAIIDKTNKRILYPETQETEEDVNFRIRALELQKELDEHSNPGTVYELYRGEKPYEFPPDPTPEEIAASKASNVRAHRNNLLLSCDWTQNEDAPLSPEERTAWKAYRQALRDIPEQAGFPESITWPKREDYNA